jgi:calcineurin-like phosphoesterase family protein
MFNIGKTKVWLISDMHLRHDNMIHFCDRPENFTELIISNWKKRVGDDDIVIDLGDVIFKDNSMLPQYIQPLPGKKILILGNHDRHNYSWYMKRGYDFVCDGFNWEPIAFSHEPLIRLPEKCKYNVHGHLHNNPYNHPAAWYDQKEWHILMALEKEGYGPIDLRDFLKSKGVTFTEAE